MKQLWQGLATGKAAVVDVPAPRAGKGQILVRVMASLISAGTERSVVSFSEKNLLQKAMARPDLVRQLVDKGKREGWLTALETARKKLDSDIALGYSNAGIVIAVGDGVAEFKVGDRVACAGGGYASHSEIVRVPRNLAAGIPPGPGGREVSFEQAAFATVAAVGLQGLRLAELQLGDVVAVIGLGLIGQIVVQLARVNGCTVVGMDLSPARCAQAELAGCAATATSAEQLVALVGSLSNGRGADSVLITAATQSDGPVSLAADVARDRARIVAVGDVSLNLPRKPYYMKELDFRVSRSYGPGRYDSAYEEKGCDYPVGYVRWTEGRNLAAILQLLSTRQLDFAPLITHRFPIEQAERGYELISGKSGEPFLGVILTYENEPDRATRIELGTGSKSVAPLPNSVSVGVIGAGNFVAAAMLPAMRQVEGLEMAAICAPGGTSARALGRRYGFRYCASDVQELLRDNSINTIAVCTRHAEHADLVVAALEAGKHVICEKPLAMNEDQLAAIFNAYQRRQQGQLLMVGYNRRFAPLARQLKAFVADAREPFVMHYRINAGYIPPEHWTQDVEIGGGRILGEVCHFVDFLSFICGHPVLEVSTALMDNAGRYANDNLAALLRFADGSVGSITYTGNGDKSFSKERAEVFVQGRVATLDDYRVLRTVKQGRKAAGKSWLRADKGHRGQWEAIAGAIRGGGPAPIASQELANSTLATFALIRSSVEGGWVRVDDDNFFNRVRAMDAAAPNRSGR